MDKDERKKFDEEIARSYCHKARAAGCTHPVTTTAVVEGLTIEVEPLREVSEIIQANGEPLKLLGSCRIFLESDNLGGQRMIDCAVIDGEKSKDTLISIDYLKK